MRCTGQACERGVKGLAPVFFGLVFYRRLAGCRQAENSPKFGNGFGA